MVAPRYFPNFREPVVGWLLLLIGIFYATIASLLLASQRTGVNAELHALGYATLGVSALLVAIVGGLVLVRVSRNLAERDKAEEELRKSKQATQRVLKKLPLGVAIIGEDKIIRYVNDAAAAMAGYDSPEVLVGKRCHETLCPAEANRCPILQLGQFIDNSERVLVPRRKTKYPS